METKISLSGEQTEGEQPGQLGKLVQSGQEVKGIVKTKWPEGCGVPGSEEVRMRPGNGLDGKSPDGGSEPLGEGRIMRPGWGLDPSMFAAPLRILSGSWAQVNFSHLGFPWQLWSNVVEHLGKQEEKKLIEEGAAGLISALWAQGVQNLATPSPSGKGWLGERQSRFLFPRLLLSEPGYEGGPRNPNSTLDRRLCPSSFNSPCHYL